MVYTKLMMIMALTRCDREQPGSSQPDDGLATLYRRVRNRGLHGHRPALDVVLDGLRRLEYRGYDSAGVAVLDGDGGLAVERKAGRLANLEARLDEVGRDTLTGGTGMGHTRWATHGAPIDRNSHPHRDTTAGSPWCTTGSSRTSRSCGPSWRPTASSWPATPTARPRPT